VDIVFYGRPSSGTPPGAFSAKAFSKTGLESKQSPSFKKEIAMAKFKMTVVFDEKEGRLLGTPEWEEIAKNLQDKVLDFVVREVEWHNLTVDRVLLERLPD
jgi:hypothetical protein